MPKYTDLAAQYRLHADLIANDEIPHPACALMIEFDTAGNPVVRTFGLANAGMRELVNVLSDGVSALSGAMKATNAQASH